MTLIINEINSSFRNTIYRIEEMQEFLQEDIDDMNFFIKNYYYNKRDIFEQLFELELRLRALRDKIENG